MSLQIDYAEVKAAARILRAINHPIRQNFLNFISQKGRANVGEIQIKFRMEQSEVSQFLAIMRKQNIVTTQRDGKFVYYSVNHAVIAKVGSLVKQMVK